MMLVPMTATALPWTSKSLQQPAIVQGRAMDFELARSLLGVVWFDKTY
jgi:hypothetical protein